MFLTAVLFAAFCDLTCPLGAVQLVPPLFLNSPDKWMEGAGAFVLLKYHPPRPKGSSRAAT